MEYINLSQKVKYQLLGTILMLIEDQADRIDVKGYKTKSMKIIATNNDDEIDIEVTVGRGNTTIHEFTYRISIKQLSRFSMVPVGEHE